MAAQTGTDKSKTLATWLALLGGLLGAHRFYLHGWRDLPGWLHPVLSLTGLAGVIRMRNLGQDDQAAWLLIPVFGAMVVVAMGSTLLIGLTSEARWSARFGTSGAATGWLTVIPLVIAMLLGGAALMGTLAFSGQMFFEYQRLSG